jgi:alpha-glucosidase
VIAAGDEPTSVIADGAPLAEVADLAALDAAASGWLYLPGASGTVLVKVGPGSHEAAVTLP